MVCDSDSTTLVDSWNHLLLRHQSGTFNLRLLCVASLTPGSLCFTCLHSIRTVSSFFGGYWNSKFPSISPWEISVADSPCNLVPMPLSMRRIMRTVCSQFHPQMGAQFDHSPWQEHIGSQCQLFFFCPSIRHVIWHMHCTKDMLFCVVFFARLGCKQVARPATLTQCIPAIPAAIFALF